MGGFCEQIIERNAPIPTEQTRLFTTSRDDQVTVSVRVCQGESRRTDDNQVLGQVELRGTPWRARNVSTRALVAGERCRVLRVDGLTVELAPEHA